jgi:hypothetical protein
MITEGIPPSARSARRFDARREHMLNDEDSFDRRSTEGRLVAHLVKLFQVEPQSIAAAA